MRLAGQEAGNRPPITPPPWYCSPFRAINSRGCRNQILFQTKGVQIGSGATAFARIPLVTRSCAARWQSILMLTPLVKSPLCTGGGDGAQRWSTEGAHSELPRLASCDPQAARGAPRKTTVLTDLSILTAQRTDQLVSVTLPRRPPTASSLSTPSIVERSACTASTFAVPCRGSVRFGAIVTSFQTSLRASRSARQILTAPGSNVSTELLIPVSLARALTEP